LRTAGLLTGSTSVVLSGEGKFFSEQGGIVIVGQGSGATFKPGPLPLRRLPAALADLKKISN